MRSPPVSVVIPTWNCAAYLGRAIESVLEQGIPDLELVVIDDGSTDDTPAVVRPWLSRLTYLRQENRGLFAARNSGVAMTRAPLVAFLDADDAWRPGALRALGRVFELDPRVGLAASTFVPVDAGGAPLGPAFRKRTPGGRITTESLLLRDFDVPGCVYRREALLDTGPFVEENRLAGDYEMWLRLSLRWKIGWLSHPYLEKRLHGGNLSADVPRMLLDKIAALERFATEFPGYARGHGRLLRRAQAKNHERLAKACLRSGRQELLPVALRSIGAALRLYPWRPNTYRHALRCWWAGQRWTLT